VLEGRCTSPASQLPRPNMPPVCPSRSPGMMHALQPTNVKKTQVSLRRRRPPRNAGKLVFIRVLFSTIYCQLHTKQTSLVGVRGTHPRSPPRPNPVMLRRQSPTFTDPWASAGHIPSSPIQLAFVSIITTNAHGGQGFGDPAVHAHPTQTTRLRDRRAANRLAQSSFLSLSHCFRNILSITHMPWSLDSNCSSHSCMYIVSYCSSRQAVARFSRAS
jgi:hypothetical protein